MQTQNLINFLQRQYIGYMTNTAETIPVVDYNGNSINIASAHYTGSFTYSLYFAPGQQLSYSENVEFASMNRISNGSVLFGSTGTVTTPPVCTGIIIGDGDTTPALSDYCLSGNLITDFTAVAGVITSIEGSSIACTGTYVITNTGNSAFTVREIGLTRASNGETTAQFVLFVRDVLSTPITWQPGETKPLVYQLKLY